MNQHLTWEQISDYLVGGCGAALRTARTGVRFLPL